MVGGTVEVVIEGGAPLPLAEEAVAAQAKAGVVALNGSAPPLVVRPGARQPLNATGEGLQPQAASWPSRRPQVWRPPCSRLTMRPTLPQLEPP